MSPRGVQDGLRPPAPIGTFPLSWYRDILIKFRQPVAILFPRQGVACNLGQDLLNRKNRWSVARIDRLSAPGTWPHSNRLTLMKLTALKPTVLVLLIAPLPPWPRRRKGFNQRFAAHRGAPWWWTWSSASIDVSTNATSEVVVDVWRKIGRKKKADEEAFLRDNPVKFAQAGGL